MIEGGCFCGRIRYTLDEGSYQAVDCHCTMCRRVHSAPYVSWLVVPSAQFAYTKGEPAALQSSTDGTRYFCGECGSHLTCVNAGHPDIVDVAIGSLDRPQDFPSSVEIFTDSRIVSPHE